MKNEFMFLNYAGKALILVLLILPVLSFAQTTNPAPAPTPISTPVPRPPVIDSIRSNQQFNRMRNAAQSQALREELRIREKKLETARRTINELYRNPTDNELRILMTDRDLITKYSSFLKLDDTGITRLSNNSNCSQSSKVVVAAENCLAYTVPGAGSSFSFRKSNYRIAHLADLSFTGNYFISPGIWQHGIFANIGDISLDALTVQTSNLQYINTINPVVDFEDAKEFSTKLAKGFNDEKLTYRSSAPVLENSTYLLRSIAYRGAVKKSVEGFVYNELDYDKRKDILIAFRVVRKHSDGSITILWKRLSSRESPKIINKDVKISPKVKNSDFVAKESK